MVSTPPSSSAAYFPIMSLKKLSFSDQLSPSRKKFLSGRGFTFGIVICFIVLTLVMYNASFKAPFLNPLFSNTLCSNDTSSGSSSSWPFSRGFGVFNSNCSSNDSAAVVENWGPSFSLSNSTGKGDVFGNKTSDLVSPFKDSGAPVENATTSDVKPPLIDNSTMPGGGGVGKDVQLEIDAGKLTNGNDSSIVKVVRDVRSTPNVSLSKKGDDVDVDGRRNSIKECDIFQGRWVRDDSKPYYPPGSCPYIDRDFDCHLNGRPDSEYVKWRWQPFGCDIPRFNATDFLERLRGKMLVFVGDSLNRNMWESLVCMLRHDVPDKKRVYEISGRHEFKKKGFYAFRFEDYNCSVDFVSSPFLVKESSFKGKNGSFETLRLDLMDTATSMYRDADILVFNTGHWWTHEKTARGEDYYQEGNVVHPMLKVLEAFKRALYTWAKWVDKNIDRTKTQVIFRGYSATHFRGGPWNSGGQCNTESEPIFNDTYLTKYPSKMKILEYVLKDMKNPVTYLNISQLTDYRKDGHPSVYRPADLAHQEVHTQDCSHWCLPGVPDTWNELLYVSLLKSGLGS